MEWLSDVLALLGSIPSWMTPSEWSATAAWVAILLAGIAAIFAYVQIRDARRVRREIAAPYVIAFFERSEAHMTLIDFVVKNLGQTAAHDIQLTINPPMVRVEEIGAYPFMEAKALREGIKMLVPGQELRLYFDDARERRGPEAAKEFEVKTVSKDSRGRIWRTAFDLDSEANQGGVQTEIHGLHWIGHRLKSMEDSLKSIASAAGKSKSAQPAAFRNGPLASEPARLAPAPEPSPPTPVARSRRSSAPQKPKTKSES